MTRDPDPDLHSRLALEIAEAHLQVRACQERALRKGKELAEARAANAAAWDRLHEAQGLLARITSMPWMPLP